MVKQVAIDEEFMANMISILGRFDSVAGRMERLTADLENKYGTLPSQAESESQPAKKAPRKRSRKKVNE